MGGCSSSPPVSATSSSRTRRRCRGVARGGRLRCRVPGADLLRAASNSGHRAAMGGSRERSSRRSRARRRSSRPSGSCATMVAHYLPELLGVAPFEVWELSAFLDDRGASAPRTNDGKRLAYHDSCHMFRELRRGRARAACSSAPGQARAAAAARPVLRVRRHVLGEAARGLAGHGRRQARRRLAADALVTADPAVSCTSAAAPSMKRVGSRRTSRHRARPRSGR